MNPWPVLPTLPVAHLLRPSVASRRAAREALKHGDPFTLEFPRAEAYVKSGKPAELRQKLEEHYSGSQSIVQSFKELMLTRLALVEACAAGDSSQVTALSLKLSQCQPKTVLACEKILTDKLHRQTQGQTYKHKERVDSATLQTMAEKVIAERGLNNITIRPTSRARVRITLRRDGTGSLRIPRHLKISRRRAKRILAHELEVHAQRAANARLSGDYLNLLPTLDSKLTEEGLAIWHQDRTVPPASLPSGFWDAYAVALVYENGLAVAYEKLLFYKKSHRKAANLILRACRGIKKPGPAGQGFLFDHLYLVGAELIDRLPKHEQEDLMRGRFGLSGLVRTN